MKTPAERYNERCEAEAKARHALGYPDWDRTPKPSIEDLAQVIFSLCGLVKELELQLPSDKKFTGPRCSHCQGSHLGIRCLKEDDY